MIYVDEIIVYGLLAAAALFGCWTFLSLVIGSNYLWNKAVSTFLKRAFVLRAVSGGGGEFTTMKRDGKWLTDNKNEIEIGDRTVTRMKNNTDLFVIHDNLGVTVSLEVADAIANLDSLGYKELAQAVADYDKEWFALNKNKIAQMLANATSNKEKEIIITEVTKKGDDVLLRLQWINRKTIPLSIVYNWAYQILNPQNNKILTENAKLDARMEGAGIMNAAKLMPYVIIVCILIGVVTFALVVLNGQGLLSGGGGGASPPPTTLAEAAKPIIATTLAAPIKVVTTTRTTTTRTPHTLPSAPKIPAL